MRKQNKILIGAASLAFVSIFATVFVAYSKKKAIDEIIVPTVAPTDMVVSEYIDADGNKHYYYDMNLDGVFGDGDKLVDSESKDETESTESQGEGDADLELRGQCTEVQDKTTWKYGALSSIEDVTTIASEAISKYNQAQGSDEYFLVLMSLSSDEYVNFENECAYYIDTQGYLYLNLKVQEYTGGKAGAIKYVTLKVWYKGNELEVLKLK